MDRLNKLGKDILNHKIEINKNYSDIVKNALLETVKNKLETEDFVKIEEMFENVDISIKEFQKELEVIKSPFAKSKEELLKEIKSLKEKFEGMFEEKIIFEINFEKEQFFITETFSLGENFVKRFFKVSENKIPELMQKGGFFQKFVILRLPQVLDEILEELNYNGDEIKIKNSSVFFNKDNNHYGVDVFLSLKIEDIEDYIKENSDDEKIKQIITDFEKNINYIKNQFNEKINK